MARYLCAQCGKPGIREEAFTQMDERYAFGACSGAHEGRQLLVREDQPLIGSRHKHKTGGSHAEADRPS